MGAILVLMVAEGLAPALPSSPPQLDAHNNEPGEIPRSSQWDIHRVLAHWYPRVTGGMKLRIWIKLIIRRQNHPSLLCRLYPAT